MQGRRALPRRPEASAQAGAFFVGEICGLAQVPSEVEGEVEGATVLVGSW
jgi:hypothetical protein